VALILDISEHSEEESDQLVYQVSRPLPSPSDIPSLTDSDCYRACSETTAPITPSTI